ncbi:DUF7117 family protein [Candidatus Halobonum tyrrellensis]|uniref:TFIIB-type zinc ribbon-containing protein n=1 Tax=Candidatus Halobonum tyrrellensis G22 TaxID=1324957 RepID=V4GUQ1_9EURY|nr:hypothetical protein [Candidatus Halobonum tyrrellensis]ESP88846.1 hypothetical protein K933_07112 [Candidatus Halobonum tyrrellensis G22]
MEVRGERECRDCGTRWSYFETGSVACPDCDSLRSVGTGERKRHTDAPAELELGPVLARLGDDPLADLTDDVKEACRAYLRKRGFVRGGDLKPLDDAYLAAEELAQAADVFARLRDPTDDERWYLTALLRAADTGERPAASDVPPRMHPARGLAAADATLAYRRDATAYLDDHPDPDARAALGPLRDRAKRVRALEGDVDPTEADDLVTAARRVGRYLIEGDADALAAARESLSSAE